jgi:valyl-tRNA synthetase
MNLEDVDSVEQLENYGLAAKNNQSFTLADQWILSRFTKTVNEVTRNLERFELGEAARLLYEFIWNEYCDWYIEMAKSRLYNKENATERTTAQYVIWYVLENTLKLLHPFMPFITETIWQHLPHEGHSIMIAEWPTADSTLLDETVEEQMNTIMDMIKAIRNMRAEVNVPPGKKSEVILQIATSELQTVFANNLQYVKTMATAEPVTILAADATKPENAMAAVVNGVEIYMPLKGMIDVEKETARLNKELVGLDKELARIAGKLSNEGFVAKAPPEVIAKEKVKAGEYQEKQAAIQERLVYLSSL